ncbi:MAG: hypothetical protein L6R38_000918 [Xanthoria sp. 2 TBL-2021]|nr:MAG: hypothetical protein L6R38_000918 [Xanthoria sp. 2 TBL-2021]
MRLLKASSSLQLTRPFRTIFTPKAFGLHTKVFSPGSITEALRKQPGSLSSLNHIVIGQARQVVEDEHIYHLPDPWDLSHVLQLLEAIPSVSRITVDMNHVKYYQATVQTNKRYRDDDFVDDNNDDYVGTILEKAGFDDFEATDLCHWTSEKWPKFIVQYFPAQHWLQRTRFHIGDPKGWDSFIRRHKDNPEFQSFAFTADFHSKYLGSSYQGHTAYVDFGPWGAGEDECGWYSLSEYFAQDMERNTPFLERHPGRWRFDLYDQLNKRGRVPSHLDLKDLEFSESMNSIDGGNPRKTNCPT